MKVVCSAGIFCLVLSLSFPITAQNLPAPMRIDATAPAPAPETSFLHMGGVSPTGHRVEVNSQYLTYDGKPWLPVMGEFHFSRFPQKYWEEEILKMKAGGVQIVAAYVFWIHHEEIEGQFDWTGQRDLRDFVSLCGRNGLYVYLRVGPWDHGEARNGGFPDWLLKKKISLRRNDPEYLKYVARWYGQIGSQIKGQLWKDGGPMLGVQLENEYDEKGPGTGAAHLAELRKIAIEAGIDPPLFSVTGWPTQDFPAHDFIPVFGGYPDDFWTDLKTDAPPNSVYLFDPKRAMGDLGAMNHGDQSGKVNLSHYPFFGAEEGGGMETSYHRRPLIQPEDIAALTLTNIGSGVNLHGYYMFHGGANPTGKLTTLQESTESGYPNDLPVVSYDFQAPLGEYGQERESFNKIKLIHFFLASFGEELAPMPVYLATARPINEADNSVARIALRARDNHGFLFINNYIRKLTMQVRKGFQTEIHFSSGTVVIPQKPVDLPENSAMIWPVNLDLGPATLQYSTAQLIARIDGQGEPIYFFFSIPGMPSEFALAADGETTVRTSTGSVTQRGELLVAHDLKPGRNCSLHIFGHGKSALIVLLPQEEAEHLWLIRSEKGFKSALLSEASVFAAGNDVHLRSTDPEKERAFVFSPIFSGGSAGTLKTNSELWKEFAFPIQPRKIQFTWEQVREAAPLGAIEMGDSAGQGRPGVPRAPTEADFARAAAWRLKIPSQSMDGLSDIFLRIHYAGDVARLYRENVLLDDDFYNGRTWEIGLKRFLPSAFDTSLEVRILPLKRDFPIYLDAKAWEAIAASGQTAAAQPPELLPEYDVVLHLAGN
jgi:hypothetical protein